MPKVLNAKTLSIFILALLFGAVIYGFAAANTVPDTDLGYGEGTISGYTVSSIVYTLDGSDPSVLDQVDFSINPTDATYVAIQLYTGGTLHTCTNTAGSVSCTSLAEDVETAVSLNVVASDSIP